MWGREMRAGLIFVLASLLVGGAFREWKQTHEGQFADLIEDLESRDGSAPSHTLTAPPSTTTSAISAAAAPTDSSGKPETDSVTGAPRAGHRKTTQALTPVGIDIDRASPDVLERLPGIGPGLASRIVIDRERHGPFRTPDGLLRVRGIGPRTLARIRPYLAAPPADSVSPIAN